jgi:hypothetical protein
MTGKPLALITVVEQGEDTKDPRRYVKIETI